ncbi:EF-P 5-aminopentanol modification-associated protein YfmH [Enterococcus timonensis]|uniref:EF-P 5-aminopentanol modification-associated protein YfmH n=1 Tax=Enterococcus timonensis TaxID=1852364 RepID=UPI0008DA78A7|nr:pitrilysin family protein [Enterococcus timonensis]
MKYPKLNEEIFTETLDNGLTVVLVPKAGFQKSYGLFSTDYGSIDETFVPLGQQEKVTVPEGIAHFLEHKLFEKEDGDVFQKFSQLGASANAFTSFTRTSYLFAATEFLVENLNTLLDFVQEPYFTKASVNKEKGIIAQEIQMYQDEPGWRLFFGLIQNLYLKHPLHIDIAGTVDSIQEITAEDLYLCYETFYHPSNMTLLVVGNLDPITLMKDIKNNQGQKNFLPAQKIQRFFPTETPAEIIAENTLHMDVVMPKVGLGIKGFDQVPQDSLAQMQYKMSAELLLELALGDSSQAYLDLYDGGLIDDSFSFELSVERGFHFAAFTSDSAEPEKLVVALKEILFTEQLYREVTAEKLTRLKKQTLGKYLQSLNSPEYIANQFFQTTDKKGNIFQIPDVISAITIKDLHAFGEKFIDEKNATVFYLLPEED